MNNIAEWKPSKYVMSRTGLTATSNDNEVGVGSRLITALVATHYGAVLPRFASGRLLDLGCGKVPLYAAYKPHVSNVICVDWEASIHTNRHVDLHCNLAAPLPFGNGDFNTIILSDVLEHIPNPDALWAEVARILAENGVVIMNVPFYYCIHEEPHDFYRYTEFALRRFASNSRLTLELIQPIGGVMEVFADLAAKILAEIPILGRPMSLGLQLLALLFSNTSIGRRLIEKSGKRFPLGYFLVARKKRDGSIGPSCF